MLNQITLILPVPFFRSFENFCFRFYFLRQLDVVCKQIIVQWLEILKNSIKNKHSNRQAAKSRLEIFFLFFHSNGTAKHEFHLNCIKTNNTHTQRIIIKCLKLWKRRIIWIKEKEVEKKRAKAIKNLEHCCWPTDNWVLGNTKNKNYYLKLR